MAPIAYATLSFSDRDVFAALLAIAEAGFDQAQILGQEPHVATPPTGKALVRLQRYLGSLGLTASVHAPLTTNVLGAPDENWRRDKVRVLANYLRFTAAIEGTEMVVHPVPNPCFVPQPNDPTLPERMRDATRRSLDDLLPVARETGVRLLLENLPYACAYPFLAMTELRELVEPYPAELVGLIIDTGHAAALGKNPAEEIRIAGDRLYATHLQDVDPSDRSDDHWAPTHGGLDWRAIRRALTQVRYRGVWTFEVAAARHGETPEELARVCRAVAREWKLQ